MAESLIPFSGLTLCKPHSASGDQQGMIRGCRVVGCCCLSFLLVLFYPMTSFSHKDAYPSVLKIFLYDFSDTVCFILSGIFLTYHPMPLLIFILAIKVFIYKLTFTFCFLISTPIYNILLLFYGYSIFS